MPPSVRDLVQQHFRQQASSFDRLYDAGVEGDGRLQRLLRPALFQRRKAAEDAVRELGAPRVLDVGCGSGRVAEGLLDAGASSYVGCDFSEPMLDLARARLDRFGDRARLVKGDFVSADVGGPFDLVVAVGLFDYIADPAPFVRRMAALCRGLTIASFPRWTWFKGPIRRFRYQVVHDCPIFDYTERELRFLFEAAGFARVDLLPWQAGFGVRADNRAPSG